MEKEIRRNKENKGRKLVRTVEETEKGFTVKTQLMKNCRNCKCLFKINCLALLKIVSITSHCRRTHTCHTSFTLL